MYRARYNMSKNYSIDSNIIIWFILTPYLNPTSQSLPLLCHMFIYPQTNLNKHIHSHIKRIYIFRRYNICKIRDWKFISLCLSSDYSLITYIYFFCIWTRWKHAYFCSISLNCTYNIPSIHLSWIKPFYLLK